MNLTIVKELIKTYKDNFSEIHDAEIYKWRAVKCFKENWDINAADFTIMLSKSLAETSNLLDSQNYLPKNQILTICKKAPSEIKNLLVNLFDETVDIYHRINDFISYIEQLGRKIYNWEKHDNDPRSAIVYLTLMYPERYYFYKFGLLKGFAELVQYPYRPIKGRDENIQHYFNICQILKSEIIKDTELIQLHKKRLDKSCYPDISLNILTQDVIYGIVIHLAGASNIKIAKSEITFPKTITKKVGDFRLNQFDTNFNPIFVNQSHNDSENKLIGDLGELWVIDFEKKRLKELNLKNKIEKIEHTSKTLGDGTGYDIKSFNEKGDEIFIEVKTTKGNLSNPFYITKNELEKSKQISDSYYLYRVYKYNELDNTAELMIIKGDMSGLCYNPVMYKTSIDE